MSDAIEVLEDVVGMNALGQICHPYKGLAGNKRGLFSFTFENDNTTFAGISEADLRKLIEAGKFDHRGRVRMIPKGAQRTVGAGALRVMTYKGRRLPF